MAVEHFVQQWVKPTGKHLTEHYPEEDEGNTVETYCEIQTASNNCTHIDDTYGQPRVNPDDIPCEECKKVYYELDEMIKNLYNELLAR